MKRLSIPAVLLLAACGDDLHRESFEVSGCSRDRIRLLAFSGMQCEAEDPRSGEVVDADPIVDVIWDDPTETSSPALRVPLDSIVSVVAHCLDDAGIVREWGCDDDSDGRVSIELEPLCVPEGCESCQACPAGSLPWKGAEGQSCFSSCTNCNWRVEPAPFVGDDVSLAVDDDGVAYVSFHGTRDPGGVFVASRDQSGDWTSPERIDPAGVRTALAMDADGQAHLAYYVQGPEPGLRYATTNAGGEWQPTESVTRAVADQQSRASISFDRGIPFIAYHDAAGPALLMASRSVPDPWETVTVDATAGGFASLVAEGGRAHVAFGAASDDGLDLFYAIRFQAGGQFIRELVENDAGDFATIRATSDGVLVLVYQSRSLELHAATRDPPGQGPPPSFEVVTLEEDGEPGAFAAMALDGGGMAHVSHYDSAERVLRYTMFDPNTFDVLISETVFEPEDQLIILGSAIDVAPDGTVHAIWSVRPAQGLPIEPIYARRLIDQDCDGVD